MSERKSSTKGFVSLGGAVTTGREPGPGEFYCVSRDFAMPLMAANVEISHSPDLALIEALRKNSDDCPNCPLQQGINAILPASDWETAQKHAISARVNAYFSNHIYT